MKLSVKIQNPEKVVFQGDVAALSSINERGKFDVLPEHANFLSIIQNEIILHKLDGKTETLKIEQGILRVQLDRVDIFLGLTSPI